MPPTTFNDQLAVSISEMTMDDPKGSTEMSLMTSDDQSAVIIPERPTGDPDGVTEMSPMSSGDQAAANTPERTNFSWLNKKRIIQFLIALIILVLTGFSGFGIYKMVHPSSENQITDFQNKDVNSTFPTYKHSTTTTTATATATATPENENTSTVDTITHQKIESKECDFGFTLTHNISEFTLHTTLVLKRPTRSYGKITYGGYLYLTPEMQCKELLCTLKVFDDTKLFKGNNMKFEFGPPDKLKSCESVVDLKLIEKPFHPSD